jgi:uncharacterized protein Yka (UPF0111/DUF47 family)
MTDEEIIKAVFELAQMVKEVQNVEKHWTEEQWREISKAIERLERVTWNRQTLTWITYFAT